MSKRLLFSFTPTYQLLFVACIWLVLAVSINPYGEFPFNDDWLYAHSVKALVETGKFYMAPLTSVNLFVQIGWGALFCLPFGFSFTALRISTLVAGGLGLWGSYRLIHASTNNQQIAFVGTILTLINPIYLGLSASFMTDVPFYALMVWSFSFLVAGLKQDTPRLMLTGLGIAVVALLIRQLGIAIFMGFGLAYVIRKGLSLKSSIVAGSSVGLGLSVQIAYQKWLIHMTPDIVMYNAQAGNFFHLSYYKIELITSLVNNTFVALMYVGFFMFPYFLLLLTRKSWVAFWAERWLWLLSAAIILGIWLSMFGGINMPIWFNVFDKAGIGPILMRDLYYRVYSLPIPGILRVIMSVVTGMSLLGSTYILCHLMKLAPFLVRGSMGTPQRAVVVLLSSFLVIYFLPIGLQVLFDRYLLPMPVLLLILIYWMQTSTPYQFIDQTLPLALYVSVGLSIGYLLFSLCTTHDYLAWNRIRWQSLNNLVARGVQLTEIDGGLEFNGWHLYDRSYQSTPTKSWWWVYNDTYVIGASVLPGYTLYQKNEVSTWLPWGVQQIIIGKKNQSGDVMPLTNPYSTD